MHVNSGAGYGLFDFSGYKFLSSADCGHYGEVILRFANAFSGRCRCREVAAVGSFQEE